jgi:hypothetical protein
LAISGTCFGELSASLARAASRIPSLLAEVSHHSTCGDTNARTDVVGLVPLKPCSENCCADAERSTSRRSAPASDVRSLTER